MVRWLALWAFCWGGWVAVTPASAVVWLDEVQVRQGDDLGWAQPDLDTSAWDTMRLRHLPPSDPILWIRAEIELDAQDVPTGRPLGLTFGGMATIEIYWDGELLPTEGTVGDSERTETPGPIQLVAYVPDRLATAGSHSVAIRMSTHHRNFRPGRGVWFVAVAPYDAISIRGSSYTWTSMISLSGMVLAGLFFGVMFGLDRHDRSSLVLSALCFAAAALLVAEAYRSLFGYTYNWHITRLLAVTGLAWATTNLLLLFLAVRFPLPGRRWLMVTGLVATTGAAFLNRGWDFKTALMFLFALILAALWSLYALARERGSALLPAIGVLGCLAIMLIDPFRFADQTFFLAMDGLLLCLFASHAIRVRRIRLERAAAQVKSARLEAELLRKHLQPHFLMNTLTALSNWVEEDPPTANRMIQALADELRTLSAVSDRSLIRLEEELRLCQSHLEVMALRKGCHFKLASADCPPDLLVPPALIHTLLENAITHNAYGTSPVEFRLHADRPTDHTTRLRFEAPLAENGRDRASEGHGTGMRYIATRLEESFPNAWDVSAEIVGDVFRTQVLLPKTTG